MSGHDWRAMASFHLTEGQAAAAATGSRIDLGPHNLSNDPPLMVGCFACEEMYHAAKGKPCPGQPPGTLAYVRGSG